MNFFLLLFIYIYIIFSLKLSSADDDDFFYNLISSFTFSKSEMALTAIAHTLNLKGAQFILFFSLCSLLVLYRHIQNENEKIIIVEDLSNFFFLVFFLSLNLATFCTLICLHSTQKSPIEIGIIFQEC